MTRTLSEIVSALQYYNMNIEENGGEVSDELLADLDALDIELADKVSAILWVVENHRTHAATLQVRGKVLFDEGDRADERADDLVEYLKCSLLKAGVKKIQTTDFPSVRIQKNPPSVEITDFQSLSNQGQYWKHPEIPEPRLDRKKILDDFKAGKTIDGAKIVQTERLIWR
jgi:hypothetical protein